MRQADKITSFVNAIRMLTNVGICYYDLNNFFNYDEYGIKQNRGHYCEFCEKARKLPNGRSFCEKSDRIEAVELAKQYKEPFFYECHMGIRELLIPLMQNDVLLGIIFVGQCRIDTNYESQISANAKKMEGDTDVFVNLYNNLPLISQKDLLNIGKIISLYFDTMILNNELTTSRETSSKIDSGIAESIREYIRTNYKHPLSLKVIANEFHINPSYASRCFSRKYSSTITEYISFVRIENAKLLLTSTEIPVGNIALNVGFTDMNYFSRMFKKLVGCPPRQYRSITLN